MIESYIKNLPTKLRAHFAMNLVPKIILRPAKLCSTHKGLNTHVIGSIFELLLDEVDHYLPVLMDYPGYDLEAPDIKLAVREVNAMNGMWSNDDDRYDDEIPESGFREYQSNGCEACVLARIGGNPESVCSLRIVLLGRTRTHGKVMIPRLTDFVNECIKRHPNAREIFDKSDRLGPVMKDLRKAAVHHYHSPRSRRSRLSLRGDSKVSNYPSPSSR